MFACSVIDRIVEEFSCFIDGQKGFDEAVVTRCPRGHDGSNTHPGGDLLIPELSNTKEDNVEGDAHATYSDILACGNV